ncbi:hypothetical protein H4582DRAFT_2058120 [Lactarius indigo]|nr:hypothetical protein H4582DRAFT_2058120 [Lactarius indigo]
MSSLAATPDSQWEKDQGFLNQLRGKDANDPCKVRFPECLVNDIDINTIWVRRFCSRVMRGRIDERASSIPPGKGKDSHLLHCPIIADSDYSKAIITEFHYTLQNFRLPAVLARPGFDHLRTAGD